MGILTNNEIDKCLTRISQQRKNRDRCVIATDGCWKEIKPHLTKEEYDEWSMLSECAREFNIKYSDAEYIYNTYHDQFYEKLNEIDKDY